MEFSSKIFRRKKRWLVFHLLLFIIGTFSSFTLYGKKKIEVILKCDVTSISLDTFSYVGYSIGIKNLNYKPFKLKKDYLICGYSEDSSYIDYYIEMYLIADNKKKEVLKYAGNYPIVEYFGEYICLSKSETVKYKDMTSLYPFQKPGKYIFRIVFCNENAFLGKSNWESVQVLGHNDR
ncbi:MAG: hypothetical protein WC716_14845 [Chitinophagaceae bacterium]|jgi:hypothetical protein